MTLPSIRSLLLLIFLLNGADTAFTYQAVCIDRIGWEANPIMRALIDLSPELFVIVKIGIFGALILWIYKILPGDLIKQAKKATIFAYTVIWLVTAEFLFCVVNAIVLKLRH